MHNSSLVAITQYFWRIRTSVLYGNQQKFNIEAVSDYLPIRIVAADSIQDSSGNFRFAGLYF